jgi:hypothetical protein
MPGRERDASAQQVTALSSPIPGFLRRFTSTISSFGGSSQQLEQQLAAAPEMPASTPAAVAPHKLPRRDFPFAAGHENLILFFSTAAKQCEKRFNVSHGEVLRYTAGRFAGMHAVVVGERGDRIWVVDAIPAGDTFAINPETPLAYPLKNASNSNEDLFRVNSIRTTECRVDLAPAVLVFVPEDDLESVARQFTPGGELRSTVAAAGVVKHMTPLQAQFLMNAPDLIIEFGVDCQPLRLVPSYLPGKESMGWIGSDDLEGSVHVTVAASIVISKATRRP